MMLQEGQSTLNVTATYHVNDFWNAVKTRTLYT